MKADEYEEVEFAIGPNPAATGRLAPQPWMTALETLTVVAALQAGGAEVRFIGGCVRDALLKRPIRDIDIATPEPPEMVMDRLLAAGIRVIPTGIDHGTVTAHTGGASFEITTLRVDVETDGRWAKVAFTDDWLADAARRDFTINTFSCTPEGDVHDPFGGLEDLGHGRVRFVGDPRARIREDVLRLLRFFRFYATYGRPPPDREALAACRAEAHKLPVLSGERVRIELFRILMSPNPADVVNLMRGERVLEHFLPEAVQVGRLRVMSWLDSQALRFETVKPHPVRRLASLLDNRAAGAEAVAERLKLSNHDRARLVAITSRPFVLSPDIEPRGRRRALYHLGSEVTRDLVLMAWAGEIDAGTPRSSARSQAWIRLLEEADAWVRPVFPLRGRDALALGLSHGPRIGRLLKTVENWWEEEDYAPTRPECLTRLADAARGPAKADAARKTTGKTG